MPRLTRCRRAWILSCALLGCAPSKRKTQAPLLENATQTPAQDLAKLSPEQLAASPTRVPGQELGALHLLYDLLDRARFGQDDAARDLLWTVLTPSAKRRGVEAFRDACSSLLARAWDLEASVEAKDSDAQWTPEMQESLAQLIMLLSIDVSVSADQQEVQSLALGLRTLLDDAQPVIADNLAWRIYDFDRSLMQEILDAPPERQMQLLAQGTLLVDDPQDQEAPPSAPSSLERWIAPWQAAREQLRKDPRWATTLQARDAKDDLALEQLAALAPVLRQSDWQLARIDPTGLDKDPLGPLIWVGDEKVRLDGEGLEAGTTLALGQSIARKLAISGKTGATMVVDRMTPAPWLHQVMEALRQAKVGELLVAAYPNAHRPVQEGFHAPLVGSFVELRDELVPAQLYLAQFSSGYRIGWNQALVPQLLHRVDEVAMWIDRYRFAYPTRDTVQVAFASDVAAEQRILLLARLRALLGARATIALVQTQQATPTLWPDSPALNKDLLVRGRWRWPRSRKVPSVELRTQNGQEPDAQAVAKVHAFAQLLSRCLAELGRTKWSKSNIAADLKFQDGVLAAWSWAGRAASKVGPQATSRVNGCIQDQASAFLAPEIPGPWTTQVIWPLPKAPAR